MLTRLLEIFAIVADLGALYIFPALLILLCPWLYWDEIYLTSVQFQLFSFGIVVSPLNLSICFLMVHSNLIINIIFNIFLFMSCLISLAGAEYYVMVLKLRY